MLLQYHPFFYVSRHFFCCGGNKVYVYSTETGDLLRELKEHSSKVTGFSVNSKNEFQVRTFCVCLLYIFLHVTVYM